MATTGDPSPSIRQKLTPLELSSYPSVLHDLERAAVATRRKEAGTSPIDSRWVGLAFSGGGIRSATFSLGVLQALAKNKLLRSIDFLSTVSGGGYIGSFLGMLFTRNWVNHRDPSKIPPELPESYKPAGAGQKTAERVENILHSANLSSKPLAWLRENGRYLSPNGSGDTLLATSIYFRNWVAIHVVLGVFMLALFLGADGLRAIGAALHGYNLPLLRAIVPRMPQYAIWWSPYLLPPLFTLVLLVIPLGWSYWLVAGESNLQANWFTRRPWVTVAALAALSAVFNLIHERLGYASAGLTTFLWFLTLCSALTLLFYHLAPLESKGRLAAMRPEERTFYLRNRFSSWLSGTLWLTVSLLIFALIDSFGQTLYAHMRHEGILHSLKSIQLLATATGLTGLLAFAQKITMMLSGLSGKRRLKLPVGIVAAVAAALLLATILISIDAVAHGFAWGWQIPYRNPGKIIAAHFAPRDKVSLSPERFIEVRQIDPGEEDVSRRSRGAEATAMNWQWLVIALGVSASLSYAFGKTFQFLNQSSHASLYSARLTRAYLGASNPVRLSSLGSAVTQVIEGDEIDLKNYSPHQEGGPIHLLNVTLNETVSGKSQIEQRDRKGLGMAIGPFGMSVGVKHHTLWKEMGKAMPAMDPNRFYCFACPPGQEAVVPEPLGLGQWTGISGAAFSTGLGARTSLGLSLLAGIANVRLGYWWDSGVDPRDRRPGASIPVANRVGAFLTRAFPVQMYLLDEFTARFHGPARQHWYLSDGGHFENMACYELIRRRVPFIIVCDNGADTEYDFEDLANLVRKARSDFNAEITFLDEAQLKTCLDENLLSFIGPLEELRRGTWSVEPQVDSNKAPRKTLTPDTPGLSLAHAALAKICYDGKPGAESILLVIKPTLRGDEPIDLLEYHHNHDDFPQETTLDQFFDEAQWESYRKLGEWIGNLLFAIPPPIDPHRGWTPSEMQATRLLAKLNGDNA